MTETPADRPPRRRKPPRPVEVVSVAKLTPRLVSVLVRGDALDGFRIEAPTGHVKVFLPADGQDDPAVRTYTPVRFDEASKTLELQFVLHGAGPASDWAERAAPGDKLAVAGPAGGSPWTRRPRTGGSPRTRARSRPWPRCWRRSRPRPPPTCTSRSRTPTTRSRSTARPRPRSAGITGDRQARSAPNWTRRRGPRTSPPGHGSGWPARPPRCAASGRYFRNDRGCRPTRW